MVFVITPPRLKGVANIGDRKVKEHTQKHLENIVKICKRGLQNSDCLKIIVSVSSIEQ